MRPVTIFRLVTPLALFALPIGARAGSFQLNEQSVSGMGAAYAGGAAAAEDASVLFFNPAGIALLENGEFQLGAHLLMPSAEFSNEGSRYNLPGDADQLRERQWHERCQLSEVVRYGVRRAEFSKFSRIPCELGESGEAIKRRS